MSDEIDHGSPLRNSDALDVEFAVLLRGIWTAVVRATRLMEHLPTLPNQHVEALQRLIAAGTMTPAALAVELRLSRPTVSELIAKMVSAGLIERIPSATDGRSVELAPTEMAMEVTAAFRRGLADAVGAGLERLSHNDQARLRSLVPALKSLQSNLEFVVGAAEEESKRRA